MFMEQQCEILIFLKMYSSFYFEKKIEVHLLLGRWRPAFLFQPRDGYSVTGSLLPSTGKVPHNSAFGNAPVQRPLALEGSFPLSQLFAHWLVWICSIRLKCSICTTKMQKKNSKALGKLLVKIINSIKWGKINWKWHLSHRFFIKLSKSNNASLPSLGSQEVCR